MEGWVRAGEEQGAPVPNVLGPDVPGELALEVEAEPRLHGLRSIGKGWQGDCERQKATISLRFGEDFGTKTSDIV